MLHIETNPIGYDAPEDRGVIRFNPAPTAEQKEIYKSVPKPGIEGEAGSLEEVSLRFAHTNRGNIDQIGIDIATALRQAGQRVELKSADKRIYLDGDRRPLTETLKDKASRVGALVGKSLSIIG